MDDARANTKVFSDNVKRRMKRINMSQSELARRSHVSRVYINRLLNGHADNPTQKMVARIGSALGLKEPGRLMRPQSKSNGKA